MAVPAISQNSHEQNPFSAILHFFKAHSIHTHVCTCTFGTCTMYVPDPLFSFYPFCTSIPLYDLHVLSHVLADLSPS